MITLALLAPPIAATALLAFVAAGMADGHRQLEQGDRGHG